MPGLKIRMHFDQIKATPLVFRLGKIEKGMAMKLFLLCKWVIFVCAAVVSFDFVMNAALNPFVENLLSQIDRLGEEPFRR